MKKFISLLIRIFIYFFFFLPGFMQLSAQTITISYYVDAGKGNDKNNGTSVSSPFRTIAKAKETIRNLNKTSGGDIIVYLRGGDYVQEKTLFFDENDGGSNDCQVVYKNYKEEVPVISGGNRITAWKLFDKEKNIYRAPVKSFDFRQLYINGSRAQRARIPNTGNIYAIAKWDTAQGLVVVKKEQVSAWKNFSKVEIVTLNEFTSNHIRLKSFATDDIFGYIKIQDAESNLLKKITKNFWCNNYWFENAYEFIDVEGEWYLNRTDGFVYYKPFEGESMEEAVAVAPYLETIVRIEGSSLDQPVQNLQFQGIEFSFATWLWPDQNGCIEHQAFHPFNAYQSVSGKSEEMWTPPSGVYVAKAYSISFNRCLFTHMGANGLNLYFGNHHCSVIGNVVYDISGNGISEGKHNEDNVPWDKPYRPKDLREVCSNNLISNNYITNCGVDYKGAVGISCGMTSDVTISHNEVCQLPFTGISVGWGWCQAKDTTVMKNNKIIFNKVHHVNLDSVIWDGGAIYTLSNQPNSLCSNNYCSSKLRGLFIDIGTGHYTFSKNVVEAGNEWLNIWNPNQNNLIADDNYSSTFKLLNNGTNCIIKNTIFVPDKNWPQEAKEIIKNAGLEKEFINIKDQLKPQIIKNKLDLKSGK